MTHPATHAETPEPPAPPPAVTVRLLVTIEPTATDRQRYAAGSLWTMTAAAAAALCASGRATTDLRAPWPPPTPTAPETAPDPVPAAPDAVGEEE